MSETQDPLVILQRRTQQRQILAMMGINQWVQPSSKTMNMADISAPANNDIDIDSDAQSISSAISGEQPSVESSNIEAISNMVDEESISHYYDDASETDLNRSDQHSPVTYSFDSTVPNVPKRAVNSLVDTIVQQTTIDHVNDAASFENSNFKGDDFKEGSFKKVAPFDLQGGRYGDWVILVDIQALNNDSQKLWQNITQALSITCETTSFPICEGMDTAELANASLAGYVFKMGRSEDIKVAALTALPDGLEHPNFTTVPALDDMLADSSLKRQLWQQLSNQN
ncbi:MULTISPECIES: hypothetical protein [unclassified Psychrobacter]|uniref:hypothetical protein n=1 Tax=unclassified Psychrobacter TaxID=196806 RepID=UPI0025FC5276|nr:MULTISPECIES: hypothetical protein [unclassified Psychrobacter]